MDRLTDHHILQSRDNILIINESDKVQFHAILNELGLYCDVSNIVFSYICKYTSYNLIETFDNITYEIIDNLFLRFQRMTPIELIIVINGKIVKLNHESECDLEYITYFASYNTFKHNDVIYSNDGDIYRLDIDLNRNTYKITIVGKSLHYWPYIISNKMIDYSYSARNNHLTLKTMNADEFLKGNTYKDTEVLNSSCEDYLVNNWNNVFYINKGLKWNYFYYNHIDDKFYQYTANVCLICKQTEPKHCKIKSDDICLSKPKSLLKVHNDSIFIKIPYQENYIELPKASIIDVNVRSDLVLITRHIDQVYSFQLIRLM